MDSQQQYKQHFDEAYAQLNDRQKQAVDHIEGPVLVIAGPGTGKTQILAARIANILLQTDSSEENILCLTYTDAGAVAMRSRLLKFIGPKAHSVNIFTFHAFCNQVIQDNLDYFRVRDLQPLTDLEAVDVFRELIDAFGEDHPLKRYRGELYFEKNRLQSLFSVLKKENWTPDYVKGEVQSYLDSLQDDPAFKYKRAYTDRKTGTKYQAGDLKQSAIDNEVAKMQPVLAALDESKNYAEIMAKYKRYDYDDMIRWVLDAFKENSELLSQYQERFHYFLVDEYQDTNGSQNELLNQLSSYWDVPNTFVVGDDDQSIFRFQGASFQNIMDYHEKYKQDVEVIVLDNNYRSSSKILSAADQVINENTERLVTQLDDLNKTLTAKGSFANLDVAPRIVECFNTLHQEAFIVEEVERLYKAGVDLQKVAILYHNHKDVDHLIKLFEHRDLPYITKRTVNILELPFINNLIALLRYLHAESEKPGSGEHDLFKIMHYDFFDIPHRDIVKVARICSKKVEKETLPWREFIGSGQRMLTKGIEEIGKLKSFSDLLDDWGKTVVNSTPQVLFEHILTKGGVLEHVMQSPERLWLMKVTTTFFNFLKEEAVRTPQMTLGDVLSLLDKMREHNIALRARQIIGTETGVNLVTVHSSKGLEFEHVYLFGSNAENWEGKRKPSSGSYKMPSTLIGTTKESDLEEQRRLYFVGMTRAEKELTVVYANASSEGKDLEASRFVEEMSASTSVERSSVTLGEEQMLNYQLQLLTSTSDIMPELIDHDLVDTTLKSLKLSVTALNKYLRCGLSFYFENIVRVPQARNAGMGFGSAIHDALESYFKDMQKHDKKEFPGEERAHYLFRRGMDQYRSHFTDKEYDLRLEYGRKILTGLIKEYEPTWAKNVEIEFRINGAQLDGIPLTGVLDKIERVNGSINVVDYKTGKWDSDWVRKKLKPATEDNPTGGDYWRQVIFYRILTETAPMVNWRMDSGELFFVEPNSKGSFLSKRYDCDVESITKVKEQIKLAWSGMHQHNFDGCGEEDCQWCTFVTQNFKADHLDLAEEDLR